MAQPVLNNPGENSRTQRRAHSKRVRSWPDENSDAAKKICCNASAHSWPDENPDAAKKICGNATGEASDNPFASNGDTGSTSTRFSGSLNPDPLRVSPSPDPLPVHMNPEGLEHDEDDVPSSQASTVDGIPPLDWHFLQRRLDDPSFKPNICLTKCSEDIGGYRDRLEDDMDNLDNLVTAEPPQLHAHESDGDCESKSGRDEVMVAIDKLNVKEHV